MIAQESNSMKQLSLHGPRKSLLRMLSLASLMACAMLLMPGRVHAACNIKAGVATMTFTMPATVTIPRDRTVGTVIASAVYNIPATNTSNPVGVNCDAATTLTEVNMYGPNTSSNNIIPTPIPGIGYRILNSSGGYSVPQANVALPLQSFQAGGGTNCPSDTGPSNLCYLILGGPGNLLTLQFMITGPLTGIYTIPATDLFQVSVGGLLSTDVRLGNSTQIIGQTCAVTTPSIPVTLGSVKSSVFTATGTKSPAVPFNIGLDCTGVATNVGITFTDNTNIGNTTNILSLSPSTGIPNATGVGIQIVPQRTGTAVKYGPDSSVAGNVNQIMLGASNSSIQSYAFTGQYISTASAVTAGPANGVATFTMSYQ
jgi:type 1 fimbria pilin